MHLGVCCILRTQSGPGLQGRLLRGDSCRHQFFLCNLTANRPDKGKTPGACMTNKKIFLQHICRSATLAGWGELYGRTGYNYIFSGE